MTLTNTNSVFQAAIDLTAEYFNKYNIDLSTYNREEINKDLQSENVNEAVAVAVKNIATLDEEEIEFYNKMSTKGAEASRRALTQYIILNCAADTDEDLMKREELINIIRHATKKELYMIDESFAHDEVKLQEYLEDSAAIMRVICIMIHEFNGVSIPEITEETQEYFNQYMN